MLANHAPGGTVFGVADDRPRFAPDGGRAFFAQLKSIGMAENRVTVLWDNAAPSAIPDRVRLDRMLVQARAHRIDIVFALYPQRPNALAGSAAVNAFASWAAGLARTFPQVRRYVIGNEFNQPRFFQPQFLADCRPVSGATYMKLLAKTYDAVNAVDPGVRIVTSVSPRGNDNCNAPSNISRSPYRFIYDMGVTYRSMGRDRPSWDEFGLHAYPNESTDPLTKGFAWPNMNYANLGRLKQALWDAFGGSPQPTFGNAVHRFGQSLASLVPTSMMIAETGWQTAPAPSSRRAYFGKENVRVTSEHAQAQVYAQLVRTAACDSDLRSVLILGLADEPDLDRFQSGLVRADGTRKPSYDAVKRALAESRGTCTGRTATWKPTLSVVKAKVDFGKLRKQWWKHRWWGFTVTAEEEATFTAGIFRVKSKSLSKKRKTAIMRGLAGLGTKKPVLKSNGLVRAYWSPLVRFKSKRLRPGIYVYGVRMTATMNPNRHTFSTSRAFKVRAQPKRARRSHR